ncbi:MAG: aminotransferase class V-fold PLP-dependent enzyme [Anaerolineae bacterium]|jgi:cysteine desulfurase/selenocysteine lyase|nr:aminotransferase class V-fold PLP-dependent enzyme [Chloroflexota bacterium]
MIYLDNAATSWPKPPMVGEAMVSMLEQAGGNPGRSGHRLSIAAGRIVDDARDRLAALLNAPDPLRVILTPNVTHALNAALLGLLTPGDRVVTTGMEHNSVMRPLRGLQASGVLVDVVPCDPQGRLDLDALRVALVPGAKLVVINHGSNVTGTLQPLDEIVPMVHAAGSLCLVDAAQTAGTVPIDVTALGVDILAFTGHKGLLGPTGTGGMVLAPHLQPEMFRPAYSGGTGSRSEEELPPEVFPDRLEPGTLNAVGIAGLGAAVAYLQEIGIQSVRAREAELVAHLLAGLASIAGVQVYGPLDVEQRTATVSIRIEGLPVSVVGYRLDEEYEVLTRVGLHCSPAAHRTLGTFPQGTVRLAPGLFTTLEEIDNTLRAVAEIAHSVH